MVDFKQFPELRTEQFDMYYFQSPHKQITEDFTARVVDVTDGDTINVEWQERDFKFPVRFLEINAPELNEQRGEFVKNWLKSRIEGQEVEILINPKNRVDKWGRLLGRVRFAGLDMGDDMLRQGLVTKFESRNEGKIPNIKSEMSIDKWF